MPPASSSTIRRRDFLKLAGAATAFSLTPNAFAGPQHNVTILIDAQDAVASSEPVKLAAEQVRKAIAAKGATAQIKCFPQSQCGIHFLYFSDKYCVGHDERLSINRFDRRCGEFAHDSRTLGWSARDLDFHC